MSCKLWGKVTSVLLISILVQECHYFMKKIEILGEMLTFSLSVHYYWKWLSFCKICLVLEKCDFLSEGFIYINKVSNSEKNIQFLRYVNLYMC